MNYWPYIAVLVVVGGFTLYSRRVRQRHLLQETERAAAIDVGTEVMTTSGLYATVSARNDDETVQLLIAPGVQVRWALAALRDVATLPQRYSGGHGAPHDEDDTGTSG